MRHLLVRVVIAWLSLTAFGASAATFVVVNTNNDGCGSLREAIANLDADREFLLRGDVFTPDVIDTWIWYKRQHEVEAVRVRPHPYEFALYYDI